MKKQDYLKWDEYFMGISLLSAERSKDPSTSVGACIVSQDTTVCLSAAAMMNFPGNAPASRLIPNICMSAMQNSMLFSITEASVLQVQEYIPLCSRAMNVQKLLYNRALRK